MASRFGGSLNTNSVNYNELINKSKSIFVEESGDTMEGNLDLNQHRIINLQTPIDDNDAVNKKYIYLVIENIESFMKQKIEILEKSINGKIENINGKIKDIKGKIENVEKQILKLEILEKNKKYLTSPDDILTPNFTKCNQDNFVVKALSDQNNSIFKMFDNDKLTFWESKITEYTYIMIEFPEELYLKAVIFRPALSKLGFAKTIDREFVIDNNKTIFTLDQSKFNEDGKEYKITFDKKIKTRKFYYVFKHKTETHFGLYFLALVLSKI